MTTHTPATAAQIGEAQASNEKYYNHNSHVVDFPVTGGYVSAQDIGEGCDVVPDFTRAIFFAVP